MMTALALNGNLQQKQVCYLLEYGKCLRKHCVSDGGLRLIRFFRYCRLLFFRGIYHETNRVLFCFAGGICLFMGG